MRGVNSSKNSGKDGRGGVVWGRCSEREGLVKEKEGEVEGRGWRRRCSKSCCESRICVVSPIQHCIRNLLSHILYVHKMYINKCGLKFNFATAYGKDIKSAPIGAWKFNMPAFSGNYSRPTDQPTNQQTVRR